MRDKIYHSYRFCLQCAGVAMIDGEMTQQCCFLVQPEIQYSQPGDQIIYHRKEATLNCKRGWTGDNCDSCATNFEPPGQCGKCARGWSGENCNECSTGWTGDKCDSCARNFWPPGQCDSCLERWTGENCSECVKGWAGPEYDGCATGRAGTDCDSCDVNFGPAGQCDRCLSGWAGDNCNYCDGFGFSPKSNCSECIQNGLWKGESRTKNVEVRLTFTGETCSDLVLGIFKLTSTYLWVLLMDFQLLSYIYIIIHRHCNETWYSWPNCCWRISKWSPEVPECQR